MKNRFLSVIIALCIVVSGMATIAFAANPFPDVLSPNHDWAATQIDEMTQLGIIKGYSDGTFKPDKAINKAEAMLLFARVAGFFNKEYASIADFAYDKYQYLLEDIDMGSYNSYKKEFAFLIYKGVISDEDIEEYVEDGKYASPFPRVDAAIFLANLMDGEIINIKASSLDFADKDEIDDEAAGYINFVVESGYRRSEGPILPKSEAWRLQLVPPCPRYPHIGR